MAAKSEVMKASAAVVAALLIAFGAATPAGAGEPRLKTLGTDPAMDAAPSLDLTYLQVGRRGNDLEMRIGISGMFPGTGGVPQAPGIEWTFDVRGRTFIAEAVAGTPEPAFYLFEDAGGTFRQLENATGTYDFADGYASILVPLDAIGAESKTRISGTGKKGTKDVDGHVHLGPQTVYSDSMATTKDYVVP